MLISDVATSDYRMFVVMDKTAFPLISLKLQVPPAKLNISTASVVLFYQEESDTPVKKLNERIVDLLNLKEGEFFKVEEFDTDNTPGYYYFNVTFTSSQCSQCPVASTPLLYVAGK